MSPGPVMTPVILRKTAIGAVLVVGLLVRIQFAPSFGHNGVEGDLMEYKMAMHRALTLGMHEVYTPNVVNDPASTGEEWEGGYFITNPPVRIYSYYVPIMIYRFISPGGFEAWNSELNYYEIYRTDLWDRMENTRGFTVAMKIPAILADLLIIMGMFLYLAPRIGFSGGLLASAIYSLNPGVILDTAHLGSHDSVWIVLLILSLYLIHRGKLELSWAVYALAALCKPQAMAFGLLVVFIGLIRFPVKRVAYAALSAAGTSLLVFLPFIVGGTLRITVSALANATFGGEPLVSLNAMNLWWLATWGRGLEVADTVKIYGHFTFRSLGLVAFLTMNAMVMWCLWKVRTLDMRTILLASATIAMAFFMVNTELHENHMMSVIPLLLLSLPADRKVWAMVMVLTVTFMMNLLLFDTTGLALIKRLGLNPVPVLAMSITGALLNAMVFAALVWNFLSFTRRCQGPRSAVADRH